MTYIILLIILALPFPCSAAQGETAEEHLEPWTPFQFAIWKPAQLFGEHRNVYGLRTNILYGKNKDVYGIDLGIGLNETQDVAGIQIGGFKNQSADVKGIQIGGFSNKADKLAGLQIGGGLVDNFRDFANLLIARQPQDGTASVPLPDMLKIGGEIKINGADAENFKFGEGTGNSVGDMAGIQIGGLVNNAWYMNGLQVAGFLNNGGNVKGFQVGPVNIARRVKGVQIGVVNYCKKMTGLQIGVLNLITEGGLPFFPIINASFSF